MRPSTYKIPIDLLGGLYQMPKPSGDRLTDDIKALKELGIARLVSLLEPEEAESLGLAEEAFACREQDVAFVQFPIVDRGLPRIEAFETLVQDIYAALRAGETTAVHCRAGIGRSGTLTSCVLIRAGLSPQEAVDTVSRARGIPVPETAEQLRFIRAFGAVQKRTG